MIRPPLAPAILRYASAALVLACGPDSVMAAAESGAGAQDKPVESAERWYAQGARLAYARLQGEALARNIVLFIGDGMGLTTVTAARILDGQQRGGDGEEHALSFETFDHTALAKTYNTDFQTPDSAGTITALLAGAKTRSGVLGIDQVPARGDCGAALGAGLPSLFELAESAGLATGVVSTTRVTHATPAAAWAHSADRDWEADTDLPPSAVTAGCRDIASQLLDFDHGDGFEVVLGGGRAAFMRDDQADPEYPERKGLRADGRDLITEWRQRAPHATYVWNAAQLVAVDVARAGPLLGLFEPGHLQFEHDRPRDPGGEPSLAEMTRVALRKLATAEQGYVLLVEGGRIDHGHHAGNAFRALTDTIALSEAVGVARQMTTAADTLILVTADHSHTLSMGGYPPRGHPILGTLDPGAGPATTERKIDRLPYTTLSYANGPGYAGASDRQPVGPKRFPHQPGEFAAAEGRPDLRKHDTTDPDYLQEALVPRGSETHGGEDVPVYAGGPGATAVRGVIEQHVLFHIMVQSQPAIRRQLCKRGACDENGVPLHLRRRP